MRSVVCFGDLKQAAIYFDRVVPVSFRLLRGNGSDDLIFDFGGEIPSRALFSLIFDEVNNDKASRYRAVGQILDCWDKFFKSVADVCVAEEGEISEIVYSRLEQAYIHGHVTGAGVPVRNLFRTYARSLGVDELQLFLPSQAPPLESGQSDPVITLTGLKLVDASKASWEQIVEVRSDNEARQKLQRLRAFLTKTYEGKSPAYVEDDLCRGLADYESARRKHGFEVVTGAISALLDAKNLQAATAVGLGAAMIGGSLAGMSAAAAVEVGKISLEIARKRRVMVDWASTHELAYLVELQSGSAMMRRWENNRRRTTVSDSPT